jgi:hypothetical protein
MSEAVMAETPPYIRDHERRDTAEIAVAVLEPDLGRTRPLSSGAGAVEFAVDLYPDPPELNGD